MNSIKRNDQFATTSESDASDEEDRKNLHKKRRRIHIERQRDFPGSTKQSRGQGRVIKRGAATIDYDTSGIRVASDDNSRVKPTNTPTKNDPLGKSPKKTVIYLNPEFVKRLVEKSTAYLSRKIDINASSESTTMDLLQSGNNSKTLDEIDLKSSDIETLRTASSMAIVRLVTESIRDDSKRDGSLNKNLAARLLNILTRTPETQPIQSQSLEISKLKTADVEDQIGQPIPVIGGQSSQQRSMNSFRRCQTSSTRLRKFQVIVKDTKVPANMKYRDDPSEIGDSISPSSTSDSYSAGPEGVGKLITNSKHRMRQDLSRSYRGRR